MARPWFEGRKQRVTEIQDAEGPNEVGQLALIRVCALTARGKTQALTATQRRERCDGRVKEPTGTRHNVIELGQEGQLEPSEMLGRAGREDEDLNRETEQLTVEQRDARCVTRRRRGGGLLSGPLGEDDR